MKMYKRLAMIVFTCLIIFSTNMATFAKSKESDKELLKLLDVDLKTLSTSGKPYRKDLAKNELEAMNLITKEYDRLDKGGKSYYFLGGFNQSKYQSRELLNKFKKDFSISSIPKKGTKHKFFNFTGTRVLTTEDFEFYKSLFKWRPAGKLTPYKVDVNNQLIYFIDESKNFTYVANWELNEKTKKIDIELFLSNYFPVTPYIFFAGYMGYPDIPEASPDYK